MRISFQHHIGLVILIYDGMRWVRSKDQPNEMHVPPNALNQDQQISLRLKDTYGLGFILEFTSDATFTIEPHLHFNYLLDISLADVLGYDLGSLLDDFGDMQKPHDLPVSSTPIRKPDLYRLGLYHYDSRQDHWVAENSYIEVRLIRTEQTRRYLSIYAYTRIDVFSRYALGGNAPMITKDSGAGFHAYTACPGSARIRYNEKPDHVYSSN